MNKQDEHEVNELAVEVIPEEDVEKAVDHYTALRQSVNQQLVSQQVAPQIKDALFILPDLFMLMLRLVGDRRVEIRVKLEIMLAITYVITPLDLIPDFIPGIGLLDDVLAVVLLFTRILTISNKAEQEIIEEYWEGDQDLLSSLQRVSGTIGETLEGLGLATAIYKQLTRFKK